MKYKNFINKEEIMKTLTDNTKVSDAEFDAIIKKTRETIQLTPAEVSVLIQTEDKDRLDKIFAAAEYLKTTIYGDRIVIFAPLYISDYCSNNCTYCGYRRDNVFDRMKLSDEDIAREVKILEKAGHKRLALEVGEDHQNASIDYILNAIDKIYASGDIRRINVNIAPLSVEDFKRLHKREIGTYILFQETYDQENYEKFHPQSLKGDYARQLFAHHNAQEAGIDDVGGGVLFGLSDYRFEVLSLFLHNLELEKQFNVGWHTVSVPRLKKAEGMNVEDYNHLIDDATLKKIVAVLRLTIPFAGIIISTRESKELREELLHVGVSQLSSGSQTDVGGYTENEKEKKHQAQFSLSDERSPLETIGWLLDMGYIPSYCTACYRRGRTGHHFMEIVKAGEIHKMCTPNALLTLAEYAEDYGDASVKEKAYKLIEEKAKQIDDEKIMKLFRQYLEEIKAGEKDKYV